MAAPARATVPVTIEIDVDAILNASRFIGTDFEDEPQFDSPLIAQIVAAAADKLAEAGRAAVVEVTTAAVQPRVEAEVRQIVERVLDEGVVTGTGYSRTVVKPLRELVEDDVKAWLSKDTGQFGRNESPLRALIKKEVDAAMATTMREEIAAAKESVRAAVKAAAADQIAKAVVR